MSIYGIRSILYSIGFIQAEYQTIVEDQVKNSMDDILSVGLVSMDP